MLKSSHASKCKAFKRESQLTLIQAETVSKWQSGADRQQRRNGRRCAGLRAVSPGLAVSSKVLFVLEKTNYMEEQENKETKALKKTTCFFKVLLGKPPRDEFFAPTWPREGLCFWKRRKRQGVESTRKLVKSRFCRASLIGSFN